MTPRVLDTMAAPGSQEWARTVTASKIPVILGLSPFQTASELWMTMSGLAEHEVLEGDHLEWGHYAEESLLQWWAKKNPGWRLSKSHLDNRGYRTREVAYTDDSLPFDNQVTLDCRAVKGRKYHVVECKTSDSSKTWDSAEELPTHVYVQVLSQMGGSGIHEGSAVAQLFSTVPRIYPVQWEQDLWEGIVDQIHDFVKTLGNAEPPLPPSDLIAELQKATLVETDSVAIDWDSDVDELAQLYRKRGQITTDIQVVQQRLLQAHGDSPLVLNGKKLVSARAGRFGEKHVAEEARHLLKDPEVTTPKLDQKKFKAKYPEVYAASCGAPTWVWKDPNDLA